MNSMTSWTFLIKILKNKLLRNKKNWKSKKRRILKKKRRVRRTTQKNMETKVMIHLTVLIFCIFIKNNIKKISNILKFLRRSLKRGVSINALGITKIWRRKFLKAKMIKTNVLFWLWTTWKERKFLTKLSSMTKNYKLKEYSFLSTEFLRRKVGHLKIKITQLKESMMIFV